MFGFSVVCCACGVVGFRYPVPLRDGGSVLHSCPRESTHGFSGFFVALAGSCLPFPAKRNGGGFVVGSGSNDNGKHVNAVIGEILMKPQCSLQRNKGNPASADIIEQPTSIPFGQTALARKRPPFRNPPSFRKESALTGQTEPRTRKGTI